MTRQPNTPATSSPADKNPPKGEGKSERSAELGAYQKKWFKDLRQRIDKGEPYVIAQADAPHEIFHAMDIPVVAVQWWSAICSAKQLAPRYLNLLNERGYNKEVCSYCSLPLASVLDEDQAKAPWGGLPKPTVIVARLTCDSLQKIFQIWSRTVGAPFYPLETPGPTELIPNWWEKSRTEWETLYQTHRLDLMVREYEGLIRFLEIQTGTPFSMSVFKEQMQLINEQEEYFDEVRKLIATSEKCPVSVPDQISNTMIPQWHRGTRWAVEQAEKFYLEVKELVDNGFAICPNEKIRLMWIGAGLWFNTSFYNAFMEEFGAVFVWSMYLPFASDGYIRYNFEKDPIRALASRIGSMNEQLHMPTWTNEWMVSEAKKNRIDGALMLMPKSCRHSATGAQFTKKALEDAGVPVLEVWADMVDARQWDNEAMTNRVREFLKTLKK